MFFLAVSVPAAAPIAVARALLRLNERIPCISVPLQQPGHFQQGLDSTRWNWTAEAPLYYTRQLLEGRSPGMSLFCSLAAHILLFLQLRGHRNYARDAPSTPRRRSARSCGRARTGAARRSRSSSRRQPLRTRRSPSWHSRSCCGSPRCCPQPLSRAPSSGVP